MTIRRAFLLLAVSVAGVAQQATPLDVMDKLSFHAQSVGSPWSLAESAAYAGILQGLDAPEEWGQGAGAYGKRFASTLGGSAIHGALALAWTQRCTRTRGIFDRETRVSGAERLTHSAEPY